MPKPTEKRPYQRHGLYAVQNALRTVGNGDGWVEALGEVGKELKAWQDEIYADLGGKDNISAMERLGRRIRSRPNQTRRRHRYESRQGTNSTGAPLHP